MEVVRTAGLYRGRRLFMNTGLKIYSDNVFYFRFDLSDY